MRELLTLVGRVALPVARPILLAASLCVGLLLTGQAFAVPVTYGLRLWLDANDTSTIEDGSGKSPGDAGFNAADVQTWRDKALGDGAQDATLFEGSAFSYSSSGPFSVGHLSSNGGNSLGYADLGISTPTVFYVLNTAAAGDWKSIAQHTVGGSGVIVYDAPANQLMVGFRGGNTHNLSDANMFVPNQPTIVTWDYNGGARSNLASYAMYRNPLVDGSPPASLAATEWGPSSQFGAIWGAAVDNRIGKEAGPGQPADWAAVLVYDRVLSGTELTHVMSFLGNEYGVPSVVAPQRPQFFKDDFTGGACEYWANPQDADYTNNRAQFTNPYAPPYYGGPSGPYPRRYLRTVHEDYATTDFVASVRLSTNDIYTPADWAFFGIGAGTDDQTPGAWGEPEANSIELVLMPNAAGVVVRGPGGKTTVHSWSLADSHPTIDVELKWDAAAQSATFSIDTDLDGTYDGSFTVTDPTLFLSSPSRLFFGGAADVWGDHFSYAFVPEPSSMVLLGFGGLALLAVARRRRRGPSCDR